MSDDIRLKLEVFDAIHFVHFSWKAGGALTDVQALEAFNKAMETFNRSRNCGPCQQRGPTGYGIHSCGQGIIDGGWAT